MVMRLGLTALAHKGLWRMLWGFLGLEGEVGQEARMMRAGRMRWFRHQRLDLVGKYGYTRWRNIWELSHDLSYDNLRLPGNRTGTS